MQSIANSVHYHVANVTFEKMHISRMVLHFRLDDKQRLWLLYCSSLRLANDDDEIPIASLSAPKVDQSTYDRKKMNALPLSLSHASDPKNQGVKEHTEVVERLERFKDKSIKELLDDPVV